MDHQTRPASQSRDAIESDQLLAGIVASAIDGIITVDGQRRIKLFNPAAENMFGLRAEEAIGEPVSRFIPERHWIAHAEHLGRFAEADVVPQQLGTLDAISGLRVDGAEFPIEASISEADVGGEHLTTVILRDIARRIANDQALLMLTREVDHRAKNALAVVQALVSLTRAPTTEAFVAAVRGRVMALGRAHSLLALNRWVGADLSQILTDETAPYQTAGQVRINGPSVILNALAVQPISMLIHELATNALKHGALSAETGHVDIQTRLLPTGELELRWVESGGPAVAEPMAKGFGSTLINGVTAHQLGGSVDLSWPPEGAQLTFTLPCSVYRADLIATSSAPAVRRPWFEGDPSRGVVLVVEDDALLAWELCDELAARGWVVLGPAASIDEATSLMEQSAPPNIAVLDVNLRGELVYPLAVVLQSRGVPFVFCTGYEELDLRFRACPTVRKPVSASQLDDELHRIKQSFQSP